MLIGVHTGYDSIKNQNLGTLITPEIHAWIKETVQDLAQHALGETQYQAMMNKKIRKLQ